MSKDNNETKRVRTTNTRKQFKNKSKDSKSKKVKLKDRNPKAAKAIRIAILVTILVIIIGSGILVGAFIGIFGDELKINESLLKVGSENSTVYDADGNLIATLAGDAKRKSITLSEMSEYLPKAYVAIEDERFYEHGGIDIGRTAYATVTYILNGGKSSFGGSTITQQVIKNITQDKERSALAGVMRKIKEISKAIQVEQYLSKDQILELYLNLIFIGGEDINGVELGSIYYFNKSAKDLSIAECAYMAGINHSPNAYKPFSDFSNKEDPEKEKAEMKEKIAFRTKTVLGKMLEVGYISEDQHKTAVEEVNNGLKFENGESASVTVDVSYHTEAAIDQIIDEILAEGNEDMDRDDAKMLLYSSGLKIYTTQKTDIQNVVEEEIVKEKYITSSKYKDKKKDENGEEKEVDVVQYSTPTMVILNHETGEVVAAATATGDKENRTAKTKLGYFNYAVKVDKQTGSSMKPISVIAPGLESGKINAATVYVDQPTTWGSGPKPYNPKNYDGFNKRYFVNMRQAIEVSANVPHVKALSNIGTEVSVDFCESVGLPRFEAEGLSLALGGLHGGVSPTEMAGAYGAIANDGEYITPIFYTKVTDSKGNVLYESKQEKRTVMSLQNAYITKNILTQPVISGTATYCSIPGMEVAAKTGTTNDDNDRWLCGFTPYYTATVWYGYPVAKTVYYSGTNPAGLIWDNVMTEIHKDLENARFVVPEEGIIRKTVCRISGKLASEACGSSVYSEIFTEDNMPTTVCEGHGQIRVCKDSMQMATDQCPNVLDIMGYLPEREKGAVWKTTNALNQDITTTCPLHGGGAPIGVATPEQNQQTPATPCEHRNRETTSTTSTCSKAGSTVEKCKDCGQTLNTTEIPKKDHTPGDPVEKAPTCTTDGTITVSCKVCKATISTKPGKPKTGHTPGTPETTNPTCTSAGSKVTKCTVCKETISTESVGSATGHNFTDTTKPTCANCSAANPNYVAPGGSGNSGGEQGGTTPGTPSTTQVEE